MQEATDKTVLGNFANASFQHHGITSRFFKTDAKFFVHTEGPDGKLADFEIKYTFGVEPLQQYLIEFPGGRLQSLTIAWDTEKKRWFHLYPNEKISSDDPLHWTGLYQNVNSMCAECHTTNFKKGYDSKTEAYNTTWSEINVSCQACHGPGEAHVEWAKNLEDRAAPEYADKGLLVNFKGSGSRYQVEACARCHSRRHLIYDKFKHGSPLMDHIVPALLREGLYHADGQILDEVYVYGSFLQSKMYQAGVRCSDCHNSHTLKLKAVGNAICVQRSDRQDGENPCAPILRGYAPGRDQSSGDAWSPIGQAIHSRKVITIFDSTSARVKGVSLARSQKAEGGCARRHNIKARALLDDFSADGFGLLSTRQQH